MSAQDIAQLIQQVGQAKAQAIAARGQIYGGVVKGLGDLATDSYKQRIQQQQLARQNAAQDQSIAASKSQVTLAQNQDTREATAFTAQQAAAQRATEQALHAQTVQALGAVRGASPAQQQGLWTQTRVGLINRGIAKPEEVPAQYPGNDAVDAELRGLMTVKEQWDVAHPKPVNLPEGGTLVNPDTGAVVLQGAPKPKNLQSKSVLLDGKPAEVNFDPATGQFTAGGQDVSARVKPVPTAAQVSISAGGLTDAAMDQAAQKYLQTGQLPPGYGAAGTIQKTKIMNRAAELDPKAALAANQATFKADSANLTNLQRTEGTLSAFEKTAGKNLDQFLSLADKIPDTGVPWLNTPVRRLNQNIVGSANMAAINAARDVAMREIARVTNDPKLSGSLTDSARAEIKSLNPENATLPQIKAVAKVLKQDMANVHTGINEQIASVKAGLGANPAAPPTQPTPPATAPTGAPTYQDYLRTRGAK